MALKIVTPPPLEAMVVSLDEAKDHLRVETNDSDLLITRQIRAVTSWLAGPNGWLGRSLVRQTLALTVPLPILHGFTGPMVAPYGTSYRAPDWRMHEQGMSGIKLPRPPVIEVTKVEMVDARGDGTEIGSAGFYTVDRDDGLTHLMFLPDFTWPVIQTGPVFLRVTYDAGYGDKGTDVDEGLRQAVLMAVARLHEARGDPFATSLQDDPETARMFAPYRVGGR